ncbi:hypothetical protein [Acidocella sp.]|uniref:hypothetical protein n=1 Tax=Acidocella sp. TaxID=50710 RepID=UPI00181E90CA|nr:hypothetical protein [Acidocella sp.]NNM57851.1 hypothetical protein [Acidocella sp.]
MKQPPEQHHRTNIESALVAGPEFTAGLTRPSGLALPQDAEKVRGRVVARHGPGFLFAFKSFNSQFARANVNKELP